MPLVEFVNTESIPKQLAIVTYAYAFDTPKPTMTIPSKGSKIVAVNSYDEVPQYVWHIPPRAGRASFLIDPGHAKIGV